MKDSYKFLTGFIMTIALIVVDLILFLGDLIGTPMFVIIILMAIVASILPVAFFKGTHVEFTAGSIRITAPFVDLDVPYESITSVTSATSMDYGLRTFGYGGLRYGSGEFTSGSLGPYIRAADSGVPLVIIIRTGKRTIAFNLKTVGDTEKVLEELGSRTSCAVTTGLPQSTPEERRSFRRKRNIAVAFSAVMVVIVLMIVAWAMTVGNVTATLNEDELSIDATMMHESVSYDEITYVELRTDVEYGDRIGGLGNGKVLTGNFRNDEFGKYRLAVWRAVEECIVVHTTGKTVVFNLEDGETTRMFYNDLSDRLNGPSIVSSQIPSLYHLSNTI